MRWRGKAKTDFGRASHGGRIAQEEKTVTKKLDAKIMAIVLTQEGWQHWIEGRPLQITDVKPEFREALSSNFIERRVKG